MSGNDYQRFQNLSFEDFRRMAEDNSLSRYEKIGFPDSYREGKEKHIFDDILSKLPALRLRKKVVLDIGPGCSELPSMLIELCREAEHQLVLVDSEEMLANLPNETFLEKIAAYYPDCEDLFARFAGRADVILSYSVLHYVFAESNIWHFLDRSLELLGPSGQMLIGDIPNVSKRKRFFSSETGRRFHQHFTNTKETPGIDFNQIERNQIDDAVVFGLISRARAQGFDAYVLPQRDDLPMANRREDILIHRP